MSPGREWTDYTSRQPCPHCEARKRCGIAESGMGMCFGPPKPGAIGPYSNHLGEYYLYPPDGSRPAATTPRHLPMPGAACAPLGLRHGLYSDLLSRLSLGVSDRKDLLRRGFPEAEILKRRYKSLPYAVRSAVARELGEVFGTDAAATVPGWGWKETEGRVYPWLGGWEGMLIPSLTLDGQIAALRIRSQDPTAGKYSYLTSSGMNGPKAVMNVHHPVFDGSRDVIRFTEGEIKPDLATILSGIYSLGLPGTSSWRLALDAAEAIQPQQVLLAFDADAWEKKEVAANLLDLAEALDGAGYRLGLEVWDRKHKGIDDLLHAGLKPQVLRGREMWATIEQLREVAAGAKPAVLDEQAKLNRLAGVKPPQPAKVNRTAPDPEERDKKNQATHLLEMLKEEGDLFHAPDGTAYVTITVGERQGIREHQETYALTSKDIRSWLSHRYYVEHEKAPSNQPLQDAFSVLQGLACFDRPEYEVHTRIAGHGGKIYWALCDAEWRVIEIDGEGWRLCKQLPPEVRFRRPGGSLPLPMPVTGGSIADLRPFANVTDEEWPLFVGVQLMLFNPYGPYPLTEFRGGQGSAKTTTARVMTRNVDPNIMDIRCEPSDLQNLMVAARNSHVLPYDNLVGVQPWLSDALCRLSTGGGMSNRKLFTNDEEAIFSAKRPVILTGIGSVASRSDLLDRSVLLNLPRITERRDEQEFWAEYEAARPRILGALLDAVSAALRNLPHTRPDNLPRMADFARWVCAAEPALGWKPGTFLAAYAENRSEGDATALESSLVAAPLIALAMQRYQDGEPAWVGTCEQLRDILDCQVTDTTKRAASWPKTAKALSNHLILIRPNLLGSGVRVDKEKGRSKNGQRYRIDYQPLTESQTLNPGDGSGDGACSNLFNRHPHRHPESVPVQSSSDGGDGGDGLEPVYSGAYIPPHEEWEDSIEYYEANGLGSVREQAAAPPSPPSHRHSLESWARENDWMLYQPKGGLPVGGTEADWGRWLERATDAQVTNLYRGVMGR